MNDLQAIQDIVQTYIDGQYDGDTKKLERACHQSFYMVGPSMGATQSADDATFVSTTLQQLTKIINNRRSPRDLGLKKNISFMQFSVTSPTTAIAVITMELFGGTIWLDQMALMKERGQWSIVNMAYHRI